jgi:hypothetical protein
VGEEYTEEAFIQKIYINPSLAGQLAFLMSHKVFQKNSHVDPSQVSRQVEIIETLEMFSSRVQKDRRPLRNAL